MTKKSRYADYHECEGRKFDPPCDTDWRVPPNSRADGRNLCDECVDRLIRLQREKGTGYFVVGAADVAGEKSERVEKYGLLFSLDRGRNMLYSSPPKLPLRAAGHVWSVGWDIPTMWAIDADGNSWKDNAHGGALNLSSKESLLSEFDDYHERAGMCRLLDLPVPEHPHELIRRTERERIVQMLRKAGQTLAANLIETEHE